MDGKPHAHSFLRDGAETRVTEVIVREKDSGISIRSGIKGLSVLKSTGSAFHGFCRDEFTTLKETWDRVLSTDIDAKWEWRLFTGLADVEKGVDRFDKAWESARETTLKIFANDDSASVQATMYRMADKVLALSPEIIHVDYCLPNKHYFEVGMSVISPLFGNYFLGSNVTLLPLRSLLVSGFEEYWEGCRSLCSPICSEWFDQV